MKLRRFGVKAQTFITRPVELDKRMTILEGSVRSSKTFAMMVKLLALCRYDVEGQRVITGKSKNSIYRNVLLDLFNLVGKRNYSYNRQTGELWLFGSMWIVIGAKDEGSEAQIRGMTIGIAYSDETTLMPRSFFMQLMARMSPENARFYSTTNPADPYHYLKREYIDKKELADEIETIHFTLDDNPNLSRKVRQIYERMYTGVFYLRFILGLWVVAEGAIYRDAWTFVTKYTDATRPVALRNRGGHQRRVIAIDYGTVNPMVMLDIFDTGLQHFVDREYYWDSKKEMKQKTDAQYVQDFIAFVNAGGPEAFDIVVDPSAASFIAALQEAGYYVTDADNEVIDGIRMTSTLLHRRMVAYHESCENFEREMQTYAWNDKKAQLGEEEPIKTNDHTPDAFRYYVKTTVPNWRLAA